MAFWNHRLCFGCFSSKRHHRKKKNRSHTDREEQKNQTDDVVWLLIGAGLIGGVAQILVTSAYRFGGASMLAPFDYASMIFAGIIGYVAFNELPTGPIILGACLVIAGGVIIIWRERQLGLDNSKTKPNVPPQGTP